ncbi:MAG TPA: sulfatase-like hydrolase/transferase [Thermoanaerobaculia bacterium]|nr:sulfatase-like hydrolase/transferase [Thermoanaerobaculia bacterium]
MRKLRLTAGGAWLLASLPLVLTAALAAAPAKAPVKAPAKAPARPKPDVVIITIDTLRADAPGFAGNKRVQTPVLDRLAAAGLVFPNAHAHNVVTLPSHTNILTGLYPYQHGVRDNTGFKLGEAVPTLATTLRAAGYATGAFVSAYPLDSEFGLDRGFQVYDDRFTEGSDAEEFVMPERRGDQTVERALAWWKAQRGKPRFLWVHLFDPHAAYDPPEPFASRFKDNPYLGEVSAADSFLAPLLQPYLAGQEPPALVVVTADHGEALGEHGEMTHGLFAYEATLKVPLVVWGQGVKPGRDLRWARHVDIFPTVLQMTGIQAGASQRPGRSLLVPATKPVDSYFESLSTTLNRGWAPLRGLLRGGRKAIALPIPELYDLPKDPKEANNLIDEQRAEARQVFAALPKESAWPPARGAVSAEEESRLRSLGYLSGSAAAKASYGVEDDPKRLVGLDRKIHQMIDLYSRGRVDDAIKLGQSVVQERPAMPLGHSLLAQALLQGGRIPEALEVMQKARAQGTTTDALSRQLGLTLAEIGRAKDAIAVLQPLADTGDIRARNALALALSEAGRQEEAQALLRKVLQEDPDNAKAYEQLGLTNLRLGRWAQARDDSRRAVELSPSAALAWNNLGVALYQAGERGDALDAWQRAVDLKRDLWDALWNLGTKALEQGRTRQGRAALERFVAGAPEKQYGDDVRQARSVLAQLGAGS